MALRQIMLSRRSEKKREELKELDERDQEFEKREKELEKAIEEAKNEEEEKAVEEEVGKFDKEKKEHEASKTNLQKEIDGLEEELKEAEEEPENRTENKIVNREGNRERTVRSMKKYEIRNSPMSVRAFDSLDMETRNRIIQKEDVKEFLQRLREMKGSKRAIEGGDLEIPVVFMELISENMYRYSKLMNRVRMRPVRGEARQTIAGTIPEAVWTEMCGAINELTFVFNQVTVDGFKVAGFIPVCNSLLEDTTDNLDLASWIVEMISEAIGLAKDKAILYGKGAAAKMPTGIVTRLAQESKPSDYPAKAPAWEDLHTKNIIKIDGEGMTGAEFWSKLTLAAGNTFTKYSRGEQFWAMNSKTYAKLKAKIITFTANGEITANLFGTLPVINGNIDILEFIPEGDIIGGYGDLYLWIERGTMAIESSTHAQFIQDNTIFKGKERADGIPVVPGAFVAMNIENKDVTTVMDFAADTANDADLNSLLLEGNTMTPAFDPKNQAYEANAVADTAKIEATTAQEDAIVAINYNGKNVKNGGTVTLLKDGTAHPLTVTVKNGNARKVYTVNITKTA